MPSSNTCTIMIDLQKVFPMPKLSHSTMYYSRQLSAYNFGIQVADQSNAVMCVWNEKTALRGGNGMPTCLLQAINHNFLVTAKTHLIVCSDNCASQLKNRMLIWLYLLLIQSGRFNVIEHKILTSGHSFSAADRDFAFIEKETRQSHITTLEDVKQVISSAQKKKPFKVLDLSDKSFFDFRTASKESLCTVDLRISAVWLQFDKTYPSDVQIKRSYAPDELFKIFRCCLLVWMKEHF